MEVRSLNSCTKFRTLSFDKGWLVLFMLLWFLFIHRFQIAKGWKSTHTVMYFWFILRLRLAMSHSQCVLMPRSLQCTTKEVKKNRAILQVRKICCIVSSPCLHMGHILSMFKVMWWRYARLGILSWYPCHDKRCFIYWDNVDPKFIGNLWCLR